MNKNFTTIFCITLVLTANFYASEDNGRNPIITTKKSEENMKDTNCLQQASEALEECLGLSNNQNNQISNTQDDKQTKIKFNELISAVLIPTRQEYQKADLGKILWYEEQDYAAFKSEAVQEIKDHASKHNINLMAAMKELYQPEQVSAIKGPGDKNE